MLPTDGLDLRFQLAFALWFCVSPASLVNQIVCFFMQSLLQKVPSSSRAHHHGLQVAETPRLEPVQYFGPIYAIALARGDTADEYTVSALYVTLYIEKK